MDFFKQVTETCQISSGIYFSSLNSGHYLSSQKHYQMLSTKLLIRVTTFFTKTIPDFFSVTLPGYLKLAVANAAFFFTDTIPTAFMNLVDRVKIMVNNVADIDGKVLQVSLMILIADLVSSEWKLVAQRLFVVQQRPVL